DLDLGLLAESIATDLSAAGDVRVAPRLAVTCLDQLPGADPERIAAACGVPLGYASHGPSRDRVTAL
ncbi:MAG TPA: hypothetical protein VM597_24895, partial [Gemmataceae bacterium]|nr:hypothetical protein [Gemmataceae bacterium]